MNKTFTVTYADEPYKTTTANGNTFECTYTGPRWILGQVDRDDDQVRHQVIKKLIINILKMAGYPYLVIQNMVARECLKQ